MTDHEKLVEAARALEPFLTQEDLSPEGYAKIHDILHLLPPVPALDAKVPVGYLTLAAACSTHVGDCPDAPGFPFGACGSCGRNAICEALQGLDVIEGRK